LSSAESAAATAPEAKVRREGGKEGESSRARRCHHLEGREGGRKGREGGREEWVRRIRRAMRRSTLGW